MTASAPLTGQFFLAMPPSRCTTRDGQAGVLLRVREPAPSAMFPEGLLAAWIGDDALAFLSAHEFELRPGRGVRLQVNHLTAREGEVRARIQSCELLPLPPSWLKNSNTNPQATPA